MAFVSLSGMGPLIPSPFPNFSASFNSQVIDATGEKFAWMGKVWTPNRGSKSIRKVQFLFGTVTKSGGSALTVSLQDISTAAGPPTQPDETQDQTVAIANADAGFASNLWYTTGNFSADRNVSFGDPLAVVVEYDGSGRLSSDVVNFRNATRSVNGGAAGMPMCALKTASWAGIAILPNILLEFSDGTFGTLTGAFPCSDLNTLLFNSGTTPDEYCLEFVPSVAMKVDGFGALCGPTSNAADFDFVLYDGTTAMTGGTVSHDANWCSQTSEDRWLEGSFTQEIELTAGTTYRLAIKPTTATNVRLAYFDVSAAGHLGVHFPGTACVINSRTNAGAWGTATATRRPFMYLHISSLDDGAGGGGGSSFIIGG